MRLFLQHLTTVFHLQYNTYTLGIGINNIKNMENTHLINFKKAQSLTGKIIEMVEEGEYCIDIMQQNLAVIGLLKSAHQMLMEKHLNSCFKNAMAAKNEAIKQNMIDEILRVTKMANK